MNPVFDAAWEMESFLRQRGWAFCFIGGLAVQRWGEPRTTVDADLTLLTGFGDEERYIDQILPAFPARIKNAREFSLRSRVLLVQASNQVAIDISLGALPFEEAAVRRASPWQITEDIQLTTCSAEDLVVYKCFADRPQDWLDVEAVLGIQGKRLDRELILRELTPLAQLKEEPKIVERFRVLLHKRP